MLKPIEFEQAQVTLEQLPYVLQESAFPEGGVLDRGQLVWTQTVAVPGQLSSNTLAFVEGLGVVALSTRALIRAELWKETGPRGKTYVPMTTRRDR